MISRSVAYSQTTITELMIPSYANFSGKIWGGASWSVPSGKSMQFSSTTGSRTTGKSDAESLNVRMECMAGVCANGWGCVTSGDVPSDTAGEFIRQAQLGSGVEPCRVVSL